MLEIVDGFYAGVFGVAQSSIWEPQAQTVHDDVTAAKVGATCDVLALRRHDAVRIIAPSDLTALLTDEVAGRTADEVATADFFTRVLRPRIDSVGRTGAATWIVSGSVPARHADVLPSGLNARLMPHVCGRWSGKPTGGKEASPRTDSRRCALGGGSTENSWLLRT